MNAPPFAIVGLPPVTLDSFLVIPTPPSVIAVPSLVIAGLTRNPALSIVMKVATV